MGGREKKIRISHTQSGHEYEGTSNERYYIGGKHAMCRLASMFHSEGYKALTAEIKVKLPTHSVKSLTLLTSVSS